MKDDEIDAVVLFYSTETISTAQRILLYQYNLASQLLQSPEWGVSPSKVKFFAYDVNTEMWPKGIQRGNPMPEDLYNEISMQDAIKDSGIPRIYIFPAQQKTVPYKQFAGFPSVESLVEFVRDNGSNSNSYRWKEADLAKIEA